jgi:hypothetical protein
MSFERTDFQTKSLSARMLPNSLHVNKLECLIGIHPFNFCAIAYGTMWTVDAQYQSAQWLAVHILCRYAQELVYLWNGVSVKISPK